nr:sulfite exporter TauE/SafE family protein [Candidatus Sigynarchaeota archaeon]
MFQLEIVPFLTAFAYGLLHTIQPCEDKAIFGFHTFGIAKNNAEAIKIVGIYALGLLTINNVLGFGFSAIGSFVGLIPVFQQFARYIWPIFSITLGIVLYIRLVKYRVRDNHIASPITLKVRKNLLGVYFLGILTGLPPCPFEIGAYINALEGASVILWNGVYYVISFSIGTVIGLLILTLIVTSFKKLDIFKEKSKDVMQSISCWILIGFGALSLVLSMFGLTLFPAPPPIE